MFLSDSTADAIGSRYGSNLRSLSVPRRTAMESIAAGEPGPHFGCGSSNRTKAVESRDSNWTEFCHASTHRFRV